MVSEPGFCEENGFRCARTRTWTSTRDWWRFNWVHWDAPPQKMGKRLELGVVGLVGSLSSYRFSSVYGHKKLITLHLIHFLKIPCPYLVHFYFSSSWTSVVRHGTQREQEGRVRGWAWEDEERLETCRQEIKIDEMTMKPQPPSPPAPAFYPFLPHRMAQVKV